MACAILNMPEAGAYDGRPTLTGFTLLIFLLGTLVGVLMGGALCVRYLRHEVAADIGPRLRRLQVQLDNLESALNLVVVTRYAELGSRPLRLPDGGSHQSLPPRPSAHSTGLLHLVDGSHLGLVGDGTAPARLERGAGRAAADPRWDGGAVHRRRR
jgi:hypothetical protein